MQEDKLYHGLSKAVQAVVPKKKLPPYSKELLARQQFKNKPFAVVICVGSGAWSRAKHWRKQSDMSALVLPDDEPPERFEWHVHGCVIVVEWRAGPDASFITRLVKILLAVPVESVTVIPTFIDRSKPAWLYEQGRWRQIREITRTYFSAQEVRHAA